MASLPKSNADWVPMTLDQLEAIHGTPEFEEEYGRQMRAVAEHDRNSRNNIPLEPDWGGLDRIWK